MGWGDGVLRLREVSLGVIEVLFGCLEGWGEFRWKLGF